MTNNEMIRIKRACEYTMLNYDGVHAVSIGYKRIGGVCTNVLAIIVHTIQKKPMRKVPLSQRIPPFREGIPTDVVESLPLRILPLVTKETETSLKDNDEKYRPVPGGAEIYIPRESGNGGVCTLGMFARSRKAGDPFSDIYLLTNAHCLLETGRQVRQPFSQSEEDAIAYSSRIVRSDLIDGGIAKMISASDADPYEILGIGAPLGTYDVSIDDIGKSVIKTGRTTGTTTGTIDYVDVTLLDIREQIIIGAEVPFASPGDSGSVVLMQSEDHYHHVIGLLWGGVFNYAVISPIQAVMDELEIDLITQNTMR